MLFLVDIVIGIMPGVSEIACLSQSNDIKSIGFLKKSDTH